MTETIRTSIMEPENKPVNKPNNNRYAGLNNEDWEIKRRSPSILSKEVNKHL